MAKASDRDTMNNSWAGMFEEDEKRQQAQEFLFYKRKLIRKNIAHRTESRLRNLVSLRPSGAAASSATSSATSNASARIECGDVYNPKFVIAPDSSEDESDVMSTSSADRQIKRQRQTKPHTKPKPRPMSTIARLIEQVQSQSTIGLDAADCQSNHCPYCKGCLMSQRYSLAKRLVQIELALFGDDSKMHLHSP